jgi:uncharacterized protein YdiU (UPF0061 family)
MNERVNPSFVLRSKDINEAIEMAEKNNDFSLFDSLL